MTRKIFASKPEICILEECSRPANVSGAALGMCRPHYKRYKAHGDPRAGRTPNGEREDFLRDVVFPFEGSECLFWPFPTISNGYPVLWRDGGSVYAHRIVCEHRYGPPPTPEHEAAHSCGNGHLGCVHPGHLRWATQIENAADKRLHRSARGADAVRLLDERAKKTRPTS